MTCMFTSRVMGVSRLARPSRNPDLQCVDIAFSNVSADRVRIAATVRNCGELTSLPTELSLQAAPLGAFLSWKPLLSLPLPAIPAGIAVTLEAQAVWPRRQPLGTFSNVPSGDVLVALTVDYQQPLPRRQRWTSLFLQWLRRPRQNTCDASAREPILPADPLELFGRRNPHWAGNLNVFIGGQSVEKHRAQSLRVYAGRTNYAFLFVGTRDDAYSFQLTGIGGLWDVQLHNQRSESLLCDGRPTAQEIRPLEWISTQRQLFVRLEVHPPEYCEPGELEIRVTQRSTGKMVAIEFSLDPDAQGPGCYVV